MKHFLTVGQTTTPELKLVLERGFELRGQRLKGQRPPLLAHRTLALISEKPSLRTRVSFQQAMFELGGHVVTLGQAEIGMGKRESAADVARVLSGMVDGIAARVYAHQTLVDLAAHSGIPVVNALSDLSHPCQALADAMTLMDEFGHDLTGRTVAFIGDGNNVARSLATICGRLGMNFVLASPPGFELDKQTVERIMAQAPTMSFKSTHEVFDAVHDADALYTDTWVSMGQEDETDNRKAVFAHYRIDEKLLAAAPPHAVVLHCLPAYRGLEITDAVIDGPRSRVFPQAHNRLHAQKGLLAVLMGERK